MKARCTTESEKCITNYEEMQIRHWDVRVCVYICFFPQWSCMHVRLKNNKEYKCIDKFSILLNELIDEINWGNGKILFKPKTFNAFVHIWKIWKSRGSQLTCYYCLSSVTEEMTCCKICGAAFHTNQWQFKGKFVSEMTVLEDLEIIDMEVSQILCSLDASSAASGPDGRPAVYLHNCGALGPMLAKILAEA